MTVSQQRPSVKAEFQLLTPGESLLTKMIRLHQLFQLNESTAISHENVNLIRKEEMGISF